MEAPTPFDLNRAIRDWRANLARSCAISPESLEELEVHLRDAVAAMRAQELSAQEAWETATARLGSPPVLELEYAKLNPQRGLWATLRAGLACLCALVGLMLASFTFWLFKLTAGKYAVCSVKGRANIPYSISSSQILHPISSREGWVILIMDVLISLLLLLTAWKLSRRFSRRRPAASLLPMCFLVMFCVATRTQGCEPSGIPTSPRTALEANAYDPVEAVAVGTGVGRGRPVNSGSESQ